MAAMKILIVEDDAPIAFVIRRGLQSAQFTVEHAADGLTGLEMALAGDYDVIVLDIMLPGMEGWSICEALRRRGCPASILMLTARDSLEDRIRGLELGADDYLSKPFHFPELLARVRCLSRRKEAIAA
jgi:two-component system copper resistance phosphate regulon response regulator CusR